MKFFLSTLILGAAASAPALGLFDGTQEPAPAPPAPTAPTAPTAPAAEPLRAIDVVAAPEVVLARIARPAAPAPAAQDDPVRVRLKKAQTIVSRAQQQDADLRREAEALEAEVARLREQLESMRGELANRGSARLPRARADREPREAMDRREVARVRSDAARAQAEAARAGAEEARDRAMAIADRARAAAERAEQKAMSKKSKKAGKKAPSGLAWVVDVDEEGDDEKDLTVEWATAVAPSAPGAPSMGRFRFVERDDDDGHEHEDHEHEHEVHTVVGHGPGGAQTFNIHVEDGEVHIYAGGGPGSSAGPFGPAAKVLRGKATAPETFRFDWKTGELPFPSKARERVRLFMSDDGDDDDEHEHEHEHEHDGDDDDDDDDRFVGAHGLGMIGVDGRFDMAELSILRDLEGLVDIGALAEIGRDIELEGLAGIDVLLEDVTNGLEDLGENVRVEVHVIGEDGEKGLPAHLFLPGQGVHPGLHKNVTVRIHEADDDDGEEEEIEEDDDGEEEEIEEDDSEEEEEIEEDDDRFVIRTHPRGSARGFFGLKTETTPVGSGLRPAGFGARDVALDVELLDLAREIQQELRAMRAELDELRREVMGAAPKPAVRGRMRGQGAR